MHQNGPVAFHRQPDASPSDHRLAQRNLNAPLREPLERLGGRAKNAVGRSDVLPQQDNLGVTLHRLYGGLAYGILIFHATTSGQDAASALSKAFRMSRSTSGKYNPWHGSFSKCGS